MRASCRALTCGLTGGLCSHPGEGVRAPRSSPNSGPSCCCSSESGCFPARGEGNRGPAKYYLFPLFIFFPAAFNLTLCARFVLLPAPRFPFLKASVFVFVPEGDPLRLCVDACAGGAAAGTVHLLPPRVLVPRPGALCPPAPAEGLWRVCKPRHQLPALPGGQRAGTGQQGGRAGGSHSVPEGLGAGILSSALLERYILVG